MSRLDPATVTGAVRAVWREAVAARVRDGRLHDFGWPAGLSALVAVGCGAAVVAGALALLTGPLRRSTELVVTAPGAESLPRAWIWLLLALLVVVAALFVQAAMRGPWWLRVLGLLATGQLMIIFGLPGLEPGERAASGVTAVALLGLVVFCLVRARFGFAWWEFSVLVALIGAPLVVGLVTIGLQNRRLGFEFTPAYLAQALTLAGALVLPLFVAAGFAIANLAVGLTLATLRQAQRLPGRSWPYAVLVAVVALRVGQTVWELTRGRLAGDDLLTFAPAAVAAAVLALGVAGLRLLDRRRGRQAPDRPGTVDVTALPEHAERIALPVGIALVALLLVVIAVVSVQGLVSDVVGDWTTATFDASVISGLGTDPASVAIAVVLGVLAVRQARAGRAAYALVLGATAVIVLSLAMRFLTANRLPVRLDVDALNLVGTAVTLAVAGWFVARRSLSADRALGLAALLILAALFSYRDLLTDPVGAVVGYTGAGLVLFGIGWDFLTGSSWGNRSSARFPTPTRVLLLVVKLLLPAILVAFAALTRDPSAASDLDAYARLGNLVLGTALLAAAYVAVLQLVMRDQALAPEKRTPVGAGPADTPESAETRGRFSGDEAAITLPVRDWPSPGESGWATRSPEKRPRVSGPPGVSRWPGLTGGRFSGGLAEQSVQPAAQVVDGGQRDPERQPDR